MQLADFVLILFWCAAKGMSKPDCERRFGRSKAVRRINSSLDLRRFRHSSCDGIDRIGGTDQCRRLTCVPCEPTTTCVDAETNKDGSVKRDGFGRIKRKQRGDSLLYKEFGVRKQLLHDLYIRFIRLAEERIGEAADYGVVFYISNSCYLYRDVDNSEAIQAAMRL
jgi:hypothetical protein